MGAGCDVQYRGVSALASSTQKQIDSVTTIKEFNSMEFELSCEHVMKRQPFFRDWDSGTPWTGGLFAYSVTE